MQIPDQLKVLKNQEIPKTAHQFERVKMLWLTDKTKGEFKPVKELSPEHLKKIRWYISRSKLENLNGYTRQNWINCIEEELRYRAKLVNAIFNQFNSKEAQSFKNIQYI